MSEQNIDYTSMIYGNRNAQLPRRATGQGTSSVNYDELYRQANQGNFSNMSANISGSAAGSADFLADYARRNNQVQQAGMSPISFNPLLGPEGMVNPNAQISNTGRTMQQIADEAQAEYLTRAAEQRDITRQGIQQAGGDRYAQARMAMEQQMALSDTRGLTAGAREGAQQTLSATQQVALNQIEATTRSELLQLKAQGVKDEFLAQEWAMQKLNYISATSPEFAKITDLEKQIAQDLATGNTKAANEKRATVSQITADKFGYEIDDAYTNPNASVPEISGAAITKIDRITADPSGWDWLIGLGLVAGGVALGIASLGAAPVTGGLSIAGTTVGFKMAIGGLISLGLIGAGGTVIGTDIGQIARTTENEVRRVNNILAGEREAMIRRGFDPALVDETIAEYRLTLDPIFH